MSKSVKQVAAIALPIGLSLAAPGIGTALGSTLGAATLSGIGGAVGGGIGGAITGGGVTGALKGAAIGGAGGYLSGGGATELFGGTKFGDFLGLPAGIPAVSGGISDTVASAPAISRAASAAPAGATTLGGITRALGNNAGLVALGLTAANAGATANSMDAAKEAARIQASAVDKAITTQAPYSELGTSALRQIQQIQQDPAAYIQNNGFYKGLADDAQQRLLANQATQGKLGSGGTASALQQALLNLGNGLVDQKINQLQTQVNTGQVSAGTTSNLITDKGAAQAAGTVGSSNALQTGYQNQINTILALQNLSRAPSYQPFTALRA